MPELTDQQLLKELRKIHLFSALDDEQLDVVARNTRQITLRAGQRLFTQGQPCSAFFSLYRGQMKLYRLSPDGSEKVIDIVNAGQTFAEAVMFMEEDGYPVTADALEDSVLLAIDCRSFIALLKQSPTTSFRLMGRMSQRLRWQLNEIDRLTLHSATFRLVSYLLETLMRSGCETNEVQLTIPKNVLASRLGIKPETFSRILSRLVQQDLIEVRRQSIVVRNAAELQKQLGALH